MAKLIGELAIRYCAGHEMELDPIYATSVRSQLMTLILIPKNTLAKHTLLHTGVHMLEKLPFSYGRWVQ